MEKIIINVFISHAWKHSDAYDTLYEWIFNKSWTKGQMPLTFRNYSIPKDDPVHTNGTDEGLIQVIEDKIKPCSVIAIPTGMYATYSKWIQKEIDISKKFSKPILSIAPWGQERESSNVKKASRKHVGWNQKSVIDGIYDLYYSQRVDEYMNNG